MGGGAAAVLAWQAGRGWEMMTTGRALRGPAGVGRDLHPQGETTDSQEDIRSNGRGGRQSHRARAGRPPGSGPQTGCGLAAKLCALKGICLHRPGPLAQSRERDRFLLRLGTGAWAGTGGDAAPAGGLTLKSWTPMQANMNCRRVVTRTMLPMVRMATNTHCTTCCGRRGW